MSLASFSGRDHTMIWLGVGNVEGVLIRRVQTVNAARETILLRGGIVGYQLPPLRATTVPVIRGDTLIFATDGIREGFADDRRPANSRKPRLYSRNPRLYSGILRKLRTIGLVVVARYRS